MFRLFFYLLLVIYFGCETELPPLRDFVIPDFKYDSNRSMYFNVKDFLKKIEGTGIQPAIARDVIEDGININKIIKNFDDKLSITNSANKNDIKPLQQKNAKSFLRTLIDKSFDTVIDNINDDITLRQSCKFADSLKKAKEINLESLKKLLKDKNHTVLDLLLNKKITSDNKFFDTVSKLDKDKKLMFLDFLFALLLTTLSKDERFMNALERESPKVEPLLKPGNLTQSGGLTIEEIKFLSDPEVYKSRSINLTTNSIVNNINGNQYYNNAIINLNTKIINQSAGKYRIQILKNDHNYELANLIGKGCFYFSLLNSILYDNKNLNKNYYLDYKFHTQLKEWYIKTRNDLDYNNIFSGLLFTKEYSNLNQNEKAVVDKFVSFGGYIFDNFILKEVGLLPANIQTQMGDIGMKYVAKDTFEEAYTEMEKMFDEGKSVIILKYTTSTLHYTMICKNNIGELCEVDTNSTGTKISKAYLKKEMTYSNTCVTKAISLENHPKGQKLHGQFKDLFTIFMGENFKYDEKLQECFKGIIQSKTGGAAAQSADNPTKVKYCFLYREQ